MDWNTFWSTLAGWALETGVKILIALALFFISFRIINVFGRKLSKKALEKHWDKTLANTLIYLLKITLKVTVVICLVAYLGINVTGLTALVTSLGVCAGLAVNGALSNLAGGVLLLVSRPFKVDDYIEAEGYAGTVEDIRLISTRLCTPDNKVVYIPNGKLSTEVIINYSEKDIRRMDLIYSFSQEEDFSRLISLLKDTVSQHPLGLKDPAPFVRITNQQDGKVDVSIRVWCKSSDYWPLHFDLRAAVKSLLEAEGIRTASNQMDVRLK